MSEEYQQAIFDPIGVEDLDEFKAKYEKVKHRGKYKTFKWRGRTLLVGFAEYTILHLEQQRKGEERNNDDSPQ